MESISSSACVASLEGNFHSPQQSFGVVLILPDVFIIKDELLVFSLLSTWKAGITSTLGLIFQLC